MKCLFRSRLWLWFWWLWWLLTSFAGLNVNSEYTHTHLRRKPRTLIYPYTAPTRLQYICGIGIPVEDLYYESITSGYVIKAEYFLPERADDFRPTQLHPQPIDVRSLGDGSSRDLKSETRRAANESGVVPDTSSHSNVNFKSQQKNAHTYRWMIYKAMEMILINSGMNGRSCVLRSICEHAAMPLTYESGMMGELLHIVLTPSKSNDKLNKPSDKDYLRAEIWGRSHGDCEQKFGDCSMSLMDQISAVFDLPDGYAG